MIVGWMTCGVRAPEMMVDICERERELYYCRRMKEHRMHSGSVEKSQETPPFLHLSESERAFFLITAVRRFKNRAIMLASLAPVLRVAAAPSRVSQPLATLGAATALGLLRHPSADGSKIAAQLSESQVQVVTALLDYAWMALTAAVVAVLFGVHRGALAAAASCTVLGVASVAILQYRETLHFWLLSSRLPRCKQRPLQLKSHWYIFQTAAASMFSYFAMHQLSIVYFTPPTLTLSFWLSGLAVASKCRRARLWLMSTLDSIRAHSVWAILRPPRASRPLLPRAPARVPPPAKVLPPAPPAPRAHQVGPEPTRLPHRPARSAHRERRRTLPPLWPPACPRLPGWHPLVCGCSAHVCSTGTRAPVLHTRARPCKTAGGRSLARTGATMGASTA